MCGFEEPAVELVGFVSACKEFSKQCHHVLKVSACRVLVIVSVKYTDHETFENRGRMAGVRQKVQDTNSLILVRFASYSSIVLDGEH